MFMLLLSLLRPIEAFSSQLPLLGDKRKSAKKSFPLSSTAIGIGLSSRGGLIATRGCTNSESMGAVFCRLSLRTISKATQTV